MSLSHFHDAGSSSSEEDELYRANIMDHNMNPRNKRLLEGATFTEESLNPSCGDRFSVHMKLAADGTIEAATFEGLGCAISTASMSMFTEAVTGMKLDEFRALGKPFVEELLGVPISAGREKCAFASIKTFQEGLERHEQAGAKTTTPVAV